VKLFATIAVLAVLLPVGSASAFQVIAPDQMQESGLNLSERGYFSRDRVDGGQNGQVQFLGGGRQYDTINYYGRRDGGGRYLGDRTDSNFRACSGDSNISELNAINGGGYAYPCQRFR